MAGKIIGCAQQTNQKVVVLDGKAVQRLLGNEAWNKMREMVGKKNLKYYEHTKPSQLMRRAKGRAILVINKTPIDLPTMKKLIENGLKAILVTAIGHDCISPEAKDYARAHGVAVMNSRGYCVEDVADMTLGLILNSKRYLCALSNGVWNGGWRGDNFNYLPPLENYRPQRLRGLTLGFIGLGAIGNAVAERAKGFGLKLIGYDIQYKIVEVVNGVRIVSRETVLREADIITLHCFYDGKPVITRAELAMMKKSAILINTARGALIDEGALEGALRNKVIAGAAIDVRATEPLGECDELGDMVDCTGHNAWYTVESVMELMEIVTSNLATVLAGKPDPVFTVNGVRTIKWAE